MYVALCIFFISSSLSYLSFLSFFCFLLSVFFPLLFFSLFLGITQVAEAMVSIRRLQKFMMYDEVASPETKSMNANVNEKYKENANENYKQNLNENYKETANENYKTNRTENENCKENMKDDLDNQKNSDGMNAEQSNYIEHCISIENGSTKWLDYESEDTLKNINIKVRPGELIAVVGQVGAGKSSLMNVILKELCLEQGSIQVCEQTFFSDDIILNKFNKFFK